MSQALSRFYVPQSTFAAAVQDPAEELKVPPGLVSIYAVCGGLWELAGEGIPQDFCLRSREIVLLPHGSAHRLKCVNSPGHAGGCSQSAGAEAEMMRFGGAGRLIRGHFAAETWGRNPFQSCLPPLVRLDGDSNIWETAGPLLDCISAEVECEREGWNAIVEQLVRLVFLLTVRSYLLQENAVSEEKNIASTGWFRAAIDPDIGPVLQMITDEPNKPWTVKALARRSNMSRSAFCERFRDVVGQPPLQYVTEHRMQKACQYLHETELAIKQIATLVGYSSVSSFSNAFKRWVGTAPATFRRSRSTATPAPDMS
jgi:AraC-like DNA-binding protein